MSKIPEQMLETIKGVVGTLGNGEFLDVDSIAPRVQLEFVFGGHRMRFWSDDMCITIHADMLDSGDKAVFSVDYNSETHKPILDWHTEPTIDLRVAADVVTALMFGLAPFFGGSTPRDTH